ncbi:MAG: hypothetical protein HS111_11345 [Kofleriaceae bacterium]|nr:hypothetical protein [Kofleriaceae bacterium]
MLLTVSYVAAAQRAALVVAELDTASGSAGDAYCTPPSAAPARLPGAGVPATIALASLPAVVNV